MHYEERVIDGVLYSRGIPNGDWHLVGAKTLTGRVIASKATCDRLQAENTRLLAENARLNESLALARVLVANKGDL